MPPTLQSGRLELVNDLIKKRNNFFISFIRKPNLVVYGKILYYAKIKVDFSYTIRKLAFVLRYKILCSYVEKSNFK